MYTEEFNEFNYAKDERLICINTEIAFLSAVVDELEWAGQDADHMKSRLNHYKKMRDEGSRYIPTF